MPNMNSFNRHSVVVVTTDATQTIAADFDTSVPWGSIDSVSFGIQAHVIGRQTNGVGETGEYYRTATFKRVAGTLSQVGSTRVLGTDNEDVAGWDVTIDGLTNKIRVRVTGAVGDTVKWLTDFKIWVNDDSPATNVGTGLAVP